MLGMKRDASLLVKHGARGPGEDRNMAPLIRLQMGGHQSLECQPWNASAGAEEAEKRHTKSWQLFAAFIVRLFCSNVSSSWHDLGQWTHASVLFNVWRLGARGWLVDSQKPKMTKIKWLECCKLLHIAEFLTFLVVFDS